MDPIAFHLGPLSIRWYGICVALAFLAGFHVVQWRAARSGFGRAAAADLALLAMLGGIVGARALYVWENWPDFRGHLLETVRIDHGGLVYYGGLIGAALAVTAACRWKSRSALEAGDLFAPGLALAQAVGRIGCFLNGCCFGHPWSGFAGVRYPSATGVAFVQSQKGLIAGAVGEALPVFPVQLVLALMNLALSMILIEAEKRLQYKGALFGLYVVTYSGARFFVEFARGDYLDGVGPFTPAQAICLVLFPVGLIWLAVARRRGRLARAADRNAGGQ